jgi:hypothetical protein
LHSHSHSLTTLDAADLDSLTPREPTDPQLAPIMALHRHSDGYVSFAVARNAGEDKDFRPLVAIRADALAQFFPAFRDQLMKDSYVSINAAWRLRRHGKDGPAHGYPLHTTERLRYLCAAYADLDYYKIGVTFGRALGRVVEMQDAGLLPKASIILKSGRGMWLIYLLCDPKDPTRAPGAFPEKLEQYFRLQRTIVQRFATIGADPSGKDAARHVRIPGSLHTGSEEYVEWWIQGRDAEAYSYSLTQLCALFGVEIPRRHAVERAATDDVRKKCRRGWVALNSRRLRDFNLLREMRGGFSEGCRHYAAWVYAHLLRTNGVPRDDAAVQVNLMGGECHPPLTPSACRSAVKTGFGKKWIRLLDQTIADYLGITPEEAGFLGFPAANRYLPANPAPPKPRPSEEQARSVLARREKIIAIIAEIGSAPPVREMGRRLIEAGFRGNHQTVQCDYVALGIRTERTRAARAERKSRQLSLSVDSVCLPVAAYRKERDGFRGLAIEGRNEPESLSGVHPAPTDADASIPAKSITRRPTADEKGKGGCTEFSSCFGPEPYAEQNTHTNRFSKRGET